MIFHRLHHRLIAAMTGVMALFVCAVGFTLHWSIRQSLEKALGEKLESVAATLSSQYTDEEVALMIQSKGPRLQKYFMQPLRQLLNTADLKRIYFFTPDHRSLLDTDSTMLPSHIYYHLQLFPDEMQRLESGDASHTLLFTGIEGHPTMSGFAPLKIGDTIMAGIGVDGNVRFLNLIRKFNQQMFMFGTIGMAFAILISIFLARSVTQPVAGLAHVSQQIGAGNYEIPIPQGGASEIGQLSHTMELMRQNVVAREKELKAMVAAVAHEIRNPLGGIELFSGLLSDEIKHNRPAEIHLDRIRSEVRYLNDIVHRFLEYAKPETAQPELCIVSEILKEVKENLSAELEVSHIQLELLDSMDSMRLFADPIHIRRILLNLMQNSIHAIQKNGDIRIKGTIHDQQLKLEIRDSGSGIPLEAQAQIFDPFFTTREKGTGLGLAIVRQLVEANGGQIHLVESNDHGTVFEMIFPLHK